MAAVYRLQFIPTADREWRKLDSSIRQQFAKKLAARLIEPKVPSAKLFDMADCYKIKLRRSGYRLVYQVIDELVIVRVVAIGRRDRNEVYKSAAKRL